MTNKILNWGFLSTARINRALITPLQVSKRNHLLAVGSRSQETADAYAREQKIPRAYGSYESLLADPDVDVIYISLPNHLHAEWTIKAVEAGKHVLCEKPLALSRGGSGRDPRCRAPARTPGGGSVHVPASSADVEGAGDRQERIARDAENDPRVV